MTGCSFFVAGLPVPQGSMTPRAHTDTAGRTRTWVQPANKRTASWREAVRAEAQRAWTASPIPRDVPVRATLHFLLPAPASRPKRVRTHPIKEQTGDLDKLQRAVFDALQGVVYVTDAQIARVSADKDFAIEYDGRCGVLVFIEAMGV